MKKVFLLTTTGPRRDKTTDRPYAICHMLTSLDGKIDGPFMSAPETRPVAAEYGRLRPTFQYQATRYGATTMEEGYAEGRAPALEPCAASTSPTFSPGNRSWTARWLCAS